MAAMTAISVMISIRMLRKCFILSGFVLLAFSPAKAFVQKIGPDLYAYISPNDASANSSFLIGDRGILVVDTGLNEREGRALLGEIRKISPLPVGWIINTHYHPENWIAALDHMLSLPVEHFVPGHSQLATKPELRHFRDYLAELRDQVARMYRGGLTIEQVKSGLDLSRYNDLRQFPQYEATFADNAAAYYMQLRARGRAASSN